MPPKNHWQIHFKMRASIALCVIIESSALGFLQFNDTGGIKKKKIDTSSLGGWFE